MKRKTKSEKEAEEKAALRQRIADVYAGACGEPADTDDFFLTLEAGSRAITALKKLFGQEGREYMWERSSAVRRDSLCPYGADARFYYSAAPSGFSEAG